jgi:aryl-alcohol dehydrogenase-like predicted oxidoreductase
MAIMTRALGRTGADVTILSYGAMELRGQPRGPEMADSEAGRLLNAVLDGGINLIDTSPDYGRSEELIGSYVGHRRDEFFPRLQVRVPDGDPGRRACALPT